MASIISWAKKTAVTAEKDLGKVAGKVYQASPVAPAVNAVGRVAQQVPQYYDQYAHQVAQQTPILNNPVTRFANRQLVRPVIQSEGHVGQLMQGNNPYHGNFRSQLGQAGTDALNIGSLVPVGKVAGVAVKGGKLLPKVVQGAKIGAKSGTALGAGYGLSDANTQNLNLKDTGKDIAKTAAISGVIGTALGGAAPAVGPLAARGGKAVGRKTVDVATMKPHRNISDGDLTAATRVSMTRSGFPDNTKPGDVQIYRKVQKKLGADVNNHQAVDDAIGKRMTWETQQAQRAATVKDLNTRLNNYVQVGGSTKKVPTELPGTVQTPKVAKNSLTSKVKLQNLSPETQAQVSGDHTVRSTADLAHTAGKTVDQLPTNAAIEQAHAHVTQPLGSVNDEQTAFIAKTIEKADTEATKARNAGNTVEADRLTRESAALHDALSEHATARGQANQALTMLYNQSPQGMLYHSLRDLGRGGVKDTPELRAKLQPHADAIKLAKAKEADVAKAVKNGKAGPSALAAAKADTMDAIGKFHQAVSQEMPQHIGDKLIGIWKAGLLSGVKTQQGNFISNSIFGGLKKISDVPATGADMAMSLVTGKRTKTATGTGIATGTIEGAKNAKYTAKTGIDRRGAGDKYEQHAEINFKHPIINKTVGKFTRGVFRGMNAADQPFWYAGFKNSMYDQAKADGINLGLSGKALKDHMDNLVANPTEGMANTALSEANKSTLNYDTMASKAIQAVHTGIDKVQSLNGRPVPQQARTIAHNVIHVLAPFVRVPTAFLSRTIDFTPMGPIKELTHQIFNKQFDQRALSQAIGEGMTGTGAIAVGIALTHNNMLSGDYPKNDQKEQQRWKTDQIQPNSVKIGGKWISLNYMGPLGLLFNAGNKLATSTSESDLSKVAVAIGGMGQGLMGQSFLQGFSGFSDAINDPARNAKSFINSQAASIVPAISNDVANLTDSWQRQADTVGESIKNKIPGLREQNQKKQDIYGNDLKQAGGRLGTVLGYKPSNDISNKTTAVSEVNRLHAVDPQNKDLQVTPTPVDKKITIPAATKGGKSTDIPLNDKQRYALQKAVGQATQSNWNKLIKTPEYQAMDDAAKAKELTKLRQDSTELATRKFVVDNNLGTYGKAASKAAVQLSGGDISKYTSGTSSSSGGSSITVNKAISPHSQKVLNEYNTLDAATIKAKAAKEPDYEYKVAQAKYDNAKASGTLSTVQDVKAQKSLQKAQVGAQFDKATRDLYNGLSNAEIYDYVHSNPNGKAIADKVLAYGDALASNDIATKNKLRDKYGNVTLGRTASGKRKSGGRKVGKGRTVKGQKVAAVKLKKINTSAKGFKSVSIKAPTFKTPHKTIPKSYAIKTPKVTRKVA